MPHCHVGLYQNNPSPDANQVKLFYTTSGGGPVKVLFIIGFAGTHKCWDRQVSYLAGTPNDSIQVCTFDNRGMGQSTIPTKKSEYTTRKMAKDAIALMDHLGWQKAHVFGHSMGAMVACKLAALVPERVLSLALLNVTGGGYQCIPKIDSGSLSLALRFLRAKTPEQRAAVDLDTHYSQEYLAERIGDRPRRSILYDEYVNNIRATGMQSKHGCEGQMHACWNHVVTRTEIESIRVAAFPVSVIHGRHDIIAQMRHAKRLAEKLYPSARMVELNGGHQLMHERTDEVNKALLELIKASKTMTSLYEWTNLPNRSNGESTSSSFIISNLDKLRVFLVYFFSLFAMAFGQIQRGVKRRLKPIRVGPALT
ncbi:hypothetical protein M569_00750 [Genlisea aurea]|uniref:AB hydrolase-1 domain-containing protein n=1 Tax=Genlisea aurea TaxID=192259 RepID=S8D3N7_9LAMI|nr:hypothetical protein M569_00750 [Genlisea aurea]